MLGPEEGREDWEGRKEGGKPAERGSTAPVRSVPSSAVGVPWGGGGGHEKGAGLPGEPIRCYFISFSFTLH